MKIISINAKYTKDENELAFNVDKEPLPGAIELVNYGPLRIGFANGVLTVRIPDGAPVFTSSIETLNERIAQAEKIIGDKADRAQSLHVKNLTYLSECTGLPVDTLPVLVETTVYRVPPVDSYCND